MITNPFQILKSRKLEFKGTLPFGQSEICNNAHSPIFRKLQLIEKWGTGFQKLSDELKEYPEIELNLIGPALSFQGQFIKKNFVPAESGQAWGTLATDLGQSSVTSTTQVPPKYRASTTQIANGRGELT